MKQPSSLTAELVIDFISGLQKAGIYQQQSWRHFLEFIVAQRFGWLSEWLRKKDEEMIILELDYMKLLIDNNRSFQTHGEFLKMSRKGLIINALNYTWLPHYRVQAKRCFIFLTRIFYIAFYRIDITKVNMRLCVVWLKMDRHFIRNFRFIPLFKQSIFIRKIIIKSRAVGIIFYSLTIQCYGVFPVKISNDGAITIKCQDTNQNCYGYNPVYRF